MKKIRGIIIADWVTLIIFGLLMWLLVMFTWDTNKGEYKEEIIEETEDAIIGIPMPQEYLEKEYNYEYIPSEEEKYRLAVIEINGKMSELGTTKDKEKWYLEYKDIVQYYKDIIDQPETVYDVYSEEDIYLMQRTVETETYQCKFEDKINVASVIFNRIDAGTFGNSVTKIITSPRQFAYWRTNISETTRLAIEYAFEIEDSTNGCVAFRSDKKLDKWGKWEYSFSDTATHHFYK